MKVYWCNFLATKKPLITKKPLTAIEEFVIVDKKNKLLFSESSQRCANRISKAKKNLKKSKQFLVFINYPYNHYFLL